MASVPLARRIRSLLNWSSARSVLSRDQLLDLTRGRSAAAFDRSIDTQVSRLRKKLERDPAEPRLIKTIWGGGYMFMPTVSHE